MKTRLKKWAALALACALSVFMLAGCGGSSGGSAKNALSISKVKSELRSADCDATVKSVSELNSAVTQAAGYMAASGSFSTSTASAYLNGKRGYPISNEDKSITRGYAFVLKDEEIKAGVNANTVVSAVGIPFDDDELDEFGTLDTAEKLAAAIVCGMYEQAEDNDMSDYFKLSYAVSAAEVTTKDDTVYVVFGIEQTMSLQS